MKDDDVAAGTPIEAWLAATGDLDVPEQDAPRSAPARTRVGPRLLLLLAGVPWIAVVLLTSAVLQRQEPAPTFPAPTLDAASEAPVAVASEDQVQSMVPVLDSAAGAAAVIAARIGSADGEYLDTAVVEATHDVGDLTIVTVRGVRLLRTADAWSDPQEIRLGVAIREIDGAAVAVSPPWRLAAPPDVPSPAWAAVDDDQLLTTARGAVQDAGYADVTKAALRRTDVLPDVLSLAVTAVAPGDQGPERHEILLTGDASAVLDASAAPAPALPIPAEHR